MDAELLELIAESASHGSTVRGEDAAEAADELARSPAAHNDPINLLRFANDIADSFGYSVPAKTDAAKSLTAISKPFSFGLPESARVWLPLNSFRHLCRRRSVPFQVLGCRSRTVSGAISGIKRGPTVLLSANSAWNLVNFRLSLIRALAGAGYEVVVAAPVDGHERILADLPAAFVPLPIDRSGMNPVADLQLLGRYSQLIRACRPAAFLGFTIKPNVYGSLAAQIAGVPTINNISGLGTLFLGKGWQARLGHGLYRLALRRSATVFFQNPDDLQAFVDAATVRPDQAKLLPGSGIDLDRFTPQPFPRSAPPTFLFIGRLLADKGVREFVAAASLVKEAHPSARFEMLGGLDPGNRTAISSEEVEGWRREGHVELLGEAADVRPHVGRATAVVLPSYREGLPRVLLEAAAMARPLVATDVPGCRSIVRRANGLLCSPRDAKSLAEAMIRMIVMPAGEREAMGRAARATVEQEFSEQIVIESYLTALREIAGKSGVGPA